MAMVLYAVRLVMWIFFTSEHVQVYSVFSGGRGEWGGGEGGAKQLRTVSPNDLNLASKHISVFISSLIG